MPQVVAGAAISGLIAGSTAAAIGFSVSAFAGSLILGGLSYALTPKPKKPPALDNNGSTVAVRQPDLTRQFVYGHTRITRGYAHMQSTGANGTLHMVLMLCEGPLRAINEVWVNDYCIPQDWIDANGNVTQGRYAGYMTIKKHLGTDGQLADSDAVNNMAGWTSNHRLRGIAYLYITMTKNQDVYPTGVPNISAIVEGPETYDPRTQSNKWSTNIAQFCRDFLTNESYGFGASEDDIDDVNIAAQINICDEIVTVPNEDVTATAVNASTDIISLSGDILKLQYGDQVQLLTSGTAPGGLSTGINYYVIPYQIKTNPRIKLASSLANAMAGIAIDITSTGSGALTIRKNGEPRYHGGGAFDTETNLSETLNGLATSMAGRAVSIGGFWTLLAGAWRTPALSLGIEDMRGNGMGYKSNLSMAESYNVVKGLFVSQINLYQNSDYPSARYQEFIEADNGQESVRELNLGFVGRPLAAQRIAKIELFRGRQDIIVTSDFSTKTLQAQAGDNIDLTVERLGWAAKYFEITNFAFDVNDGNIITKLALRETAQEIFDWSNGEAITYDPAPNTNLPDPFNVQVPSGVQYNSRSVETTSGDNLYIVQLGWDLHPDAFVREFGDFEIQYKKSTSAAWIPLSPVDGEAIETDVFTASVGTEYDIRIRARNNLGVRSSWATLYEIIVGSSGGVTINNDWGSVADAPSLFFDWGNVSDAPGSSDDWGYVL